MTKTLDKKGKEVKSMKNTFWLDGWEGESHSGFYIRSDLFKKIKHFEESGFNVVGIVVEPGSYNLQFICEKQTSSEPFKKEVKEWEQK